MNTNVEEIYDVLLDTEITIISNKITDHFIKNGWETNEIINNDESEILIKKNISDFPNLDIRNIQGHIHNVINKIIYNPS
jgi:hypothetical protein